MAEISFPTIILRSGKEIPLLAGHPWVFSNAIEKESKGLGLGDVVMVVTKKGDVVGLGAYNPLTSIRVRMLSRNASEKIDADFFIGRIAKANAFRAGLLSSDTTGYRAVHAEADGLPGLIVDRYGDTVVFQIHTAGAERFRLEILAALASVFHPIAIVERSDLAGRKQEGLTDFPVRVHAGEVSEPVPFLENGMTFFADVLKGQKTGFFLDQRDARSLARRHAKGRRVLNLFSYSGAFGVASALGGAECVLNADSSASALESAKKNFKANGFSADDTRFRFEEADIFARMRERKLFSSGETPYDFLVCDPPALAKSGNKVLQAKQAYLALNGYALSHLANGGLLLTSSCSGRITPEDFRDILKVAAGRSRREVRLLEWLGHAADHAELLAFPEGRYLKTALLQVTDVL